MFQKLLRFALILFLVTGGVYVIHRFVLGAFGGSSDLEFLHFSYKFNFGITLLFTSTIILISEKLKEQIGFIFLAEGMLKLGLLLYLSEILGFELNKSNFLVFFIPYVCGLLVELFFIMRILKDMDANDDA